ncbi:4'-phosphopantetheinyl transferase superfamily protein [uncultured Bacteroides sp.]|uniref:4'-phosphopantetheinyl transferase family protein n=1 Tax=uncultured Bacteroides sp. TaxID=162156 RepID=UPI002AA7029A|nr:4'-phosphopantetheinyl transferase superfamily protein [uncultured Bacteroides sp.]
MAIFLKHTEENCRWGVWHTNESVDELLALLPHREAYKADITRFTSASRSVEWLAVRLLLHTLLGEEKTICYQPNGRPYLADHSSFISISHTRGYVAVILSPSAIVGIDIEQYSERVCKVAHKFIREDEVVFPYQESDTWALLLHWSAKEVLFKCLDVAEVDFRKHLCVHPFHPQESGVFCAQEFRTVEQRTFEIHYLLRSEFVLTWSAEKV